MRSIGQTLIAAHSLVWRNGTAPSRRDLSRGCGVLAEARPRSPDDTGQTRRRAALLHHPLGHHPKTRAADENPQRARQSAGQRRPSKAVQLCNFARRCRLPQIGFVTDSPLEGVDSNFWFRADELGSGHHPRWGSGVVSVIRPPARRFRRFTRRLARDIVHAPSGGSSSLKPSIGVLPLTTMSGNHAKEDFADSMVEPIIHLSAVSAGTCFWPPTVALDPAAR